MLENFLLEAGARWSDWTWLGNAVLTLPIVAVAVLMLAMQQHWRAAFAWGAATLTAAAIVAASKVAFYAWGLGVRPWNLTCISGHTMMAQLCWPVLLTLSVPARRPRWRVAAAAAGVMLAVLVGISRVETGAHSWAEVWSGFLLGGLMLAWLRPWLGGAELGWRAPLAAGATALVLAVMVLPQLPHGHLPSERWWQQAARQITDRPAVYMRASWLRGERH